MKKSMITITALLAVAFMATSAFSWGHGRGGAGSGGCGGRGMDAKAAYTNLTPEQQEQLTTLRQKFVDETYELRMAKMDTRNAMRMMLETSNPDRAELEALSNELTDVQKQIHAKRIDFALAAKKIAPELNLAGFGRHGGKGRGYHHRGQGQSDCPARGQAGGCTYQ